jgi:hypothetical protein
MEPEAFYKMTPAEFWVKAEGYNRSRIERVNELLFLAWHIAYFTREPKPPKLKDVLIGDHKSSAESKEQTPEQMVVACKMITAALGGNFIEVTDG